MNKLESNFWATIRRNTKTHDIHWQRIESGTAPGIPDLEGCQGGRTCWIELKVAKGNKVLLTHDQCNWLHKRAHHAGRAWILAIKDNKTIKAWKGDSAGMVQQTGWDCSTAFIWDRPFPWMEITAVLFS